MEIVKSCFWLFLANGRLVRYHTFQPRENLLAMFLPNMQERGQRGDEDDREDQQRKIAIETGDAAEKVANQISDHRHADAPEDTAKQIEEKEAAIVHRDRAGDNRREGADEGHKARSGNRHAAISVVKLFCL